MENELKTIKKRGVWHLANLPANTIPIGCRWIFTVKKDESGNIKVFKARLVAQGFKQIKGISYDETFSPVVNFGVLRFFFTLLVSYSKWKHIQCDVTGAYLYAPLKENVYMSQPPGFETSKGKYCKLDKALYGLHQSGREWFFEIHKVLIEIGYKNFERCNCAYTHQNNLVLVLYVDDFVLFGKTKNTINDAISTLTKHFEIKVLGRTKKLLGVEFEETATSIFIHQSTYIDEVYERFNKYKIPISSLPISKGKVFSKSTCPKTDTEITEMSRYPYRSVLGCLSFISNRTRPDISYAVNIFSQFQSNPSLDQWEGLLRLLGYVKYTSSYKLNLICNKPHITIYSDADFAANRDDRTSIGGQLLLLGDSPVNWRTFKEKCVALSTMEAELIGVCEASKELIWYNEILAECKSKRLITDKLIDPILYGDNLATLDFIKSPIENYRTKHIDVKLFFIRDLVRQNKFQLKFVNSKNNLADPFTKPLTKSNLNNFIQNIFQTSQN